MLSRSLFLYFCTMYLFYFVKNSLKSAKSSQLTGMEENIPQEMTKLDESGWQDSDILDDENDLDLLPLVTYAFNALNNLSIVDDNWYSGSKEPRLVHPENVLFHVGEVVCLVTDDNLAVVIGWDETYQGPRDWYDVGSYLEEPFYLVLTDYQNSEMEYEPFLYVPQEELSRVKKPRRIYNEYLEDYFEHFSVDRYIMRPWLENIYPKDH